MLTKDLLIEIGTEELPPKILSMLANTFATNFNQQLLDARLAFEKLQWYATPRRLALKVIALQTQQADREIQKRGPALAQAFDGNGQPTKAAQGWAKSCGIDVEQAERLVLENGEWLVYNAIEKGKKAEDFLLALINNVLLKLPVPKLMKWGDKAIKFVRPVHTVTVLLGEQVIEGEVLGLKSDRVILGHRFMGEKQFQIDNASQYPDILLQKGSVIADFDYRKQLILDGVAKAAEKVNGIADIDDNLVEEVVSLVEYPTVLTAKFESRFLSVPVEALVYTMKKDQKYFPLYDKNGGLLPYFIFVANVNPTDPTDIISGNEKVVRARLSDAEFFFKTDLKSRLEDNLPKLENVLFHNKLGSLADKTQRLINLAAMIASQIGADVEQTKRAALLSKCDLLTNMVFEFPETQGIMAMHYARHDGEDEWVALALNEQYMPRFAGDKLPQNPVASVLALADKIDTLTGIFGIGEHPKSDKDPFALRRAALGVLRIIITSDLHLDLVSLIEHAASIYGNKLTNSNVVADVVDFVLGRLKAWYQEQGYPIDVIQAVLACKPTQPADFDARIKALNYFRDLPSAQTLITANKRVSNILVNAQMPSFLNIDLSLCLEPAEITLANTIIHLQPELQSLFDKGDYHTALARLLTLNQLVDDFFTNVLVNSEDEKIRQNRLVLLKNLQTLFLRIADISILQ